MFSTEILPSKSPIPEKKIEHFGAIVVGGGIAGLAVTWEIARQNIPVLLVTDREFKFTRAQLIRKTDVMFDYLAKMLRENNESSDEDFFNPRFSLVAIKDVEKFLFARLKIVEKNIQYLPLSQVTDIRLKKGEVTVSSQDGSKKEYSFDNLIATDGAHHKTGNILARKQLGMPQPFGSKKYPRFCYETFYKENGNKQGAMHGMIVCSKDKKILTIPDIDCLIVADSLEKYFAFVFLDRQSYEKSQGLQMKWSIVGQKPEFIIETDIDALKKYFIELLIKSFKENGIDFNSDDLIIDMMANDKPNISLFKKDIAAVSHSVFEDKGKNKSKNKNKDKDNHKRRFISVGLSALSVDYTYGLGVANAFNQAYLLGEMFRENFSQRSVDEFRSEFRHQKSIEKRFAGFFTKTSRIVQHAKIDAAKERRALEQYRVAR